MELAPRAFRLTTGASAAVYATQLVYPLARLMRMTTSEPAPEIVPNKGFDISKPVR